MIKLIEYFSFQEILDYIKSNTSLTTPRYPNDNNISLIEGGWIMPIISHYNLTFNLNGLSEEYDLDEEIPNIITNLLTIVYDRHADDIVYQGEQIVINGNENYLLQDKDIKKVLSKFINILNLTAPKYIPLFTKYKEASINPIAPIKSTSKGTTHFNDTPQNDIDEWDEEDHVTNMSGSESETSVDVGTLMERLASMFKDYKSIILEWSNEFNQIFFKEEQLCF